MWTNGNVVVSRILTFQWLSMILCGRQSQMPELLTVMIAMSPFGLFFVLSRKFNPFGKVLVALHYDMSHLSIVVLRE